MTRTSARFGAGIRAIGRQLPDRVITNAELETRFDTSDAWIREHIGIETWRVSAPGEWTSDLGAAALRDACSVAGVDLSTVDLVICGTYTPDHMIPPAAVAIMRKAGLADVPGFDVNSGGCPGSVFALDVGAKFVESGAYRRVAVVLADVSTKAFDPADRTVGVIFGDGAACYLLEPTTVGTGIGDTRLRTDHSGYYSGYVSREPRSAPDGTPVRSSFGDNFTVMVGKDIRAFTLEVIPGFLRELVEKDGGAVDDLDLVVLHQANLHIVHGILERLGVPETRTLTNVQRIGNTSGASVPLVLREAVDAGRVAAGDRVLISAFGAGLNFGAALIRWCGPEDFVATL
ncbi:ketoacyl-ACP synthase III [Amycolatopsis ultiminotia]|uniref:Ketoacyl-ACP synthase III n=1 Tax=Amycolatopsis ultiminotia TaxID=543629 RepID=A0ABP6XI12_9PSEU